MGELWAPLGTRIGFKHPREFESKKSFVSKQDSNHNEYFFVAAANYVLLTTTALVKSTLNNDVYLRRTICNSLQRIVQAAAEFVQTYDVQTELENVHVKLLRAESETLRQEISSNKNHETANEYTAEQKSLFFKFFGESFGLKQTREENTNKTDTTHIESTTDEPTSADMPKALATLHSLTQLPKTAMKMLPIEYKRATELIELLGWHFSGTDSPQEPTIESQENDPEYQGILQAYLNPTTETSKKHARFAKLPSEPPLVSEQEFDSEDSPLEIAPFEPHRCNSNEDIGSALKPVLHGKDLIDEFKKSQRIAEETAKAWDRVRELSMQIDSDNMSLDLSEAAQEALQDYEQVGIIDPDFKPRELPASIGEAISLGEKVLLASKEAEFSNIDLSEMKYRQIAKTIKDLLPALELINSAAEECLLASADISERLEEMRQDALKHWEFYRNEARNEVCQANLTFNRAVKMLIANGASPQILRAYIECFHVDGIKPVENPDHIWDSEAVCGVSELVSNYPQQVQSWFENLCGMPLVKIIERARIVSESYMTAGIIGSAGLLRAYMTCQTVYVALQKLINNIDAFELHVFAPISDAALLMEKLNKRWNQHLKYNGAAKNMERGHALMHTKLENRAIVERVDELTGGGAFDVLCKSLRLDYFTKVELFGEIDNDNEND